MGHRLSEDEVQQALDFCGKLFDPTTPDEHRAAARLLAEIPKGDATGNSEATNLRFLDVHAPIISPQTIDNFVREKFASGTDDSAPDFQSNSGHGGLNMKMILDKVNARRVVEAGNDAVHNFEEEALGQPGTGGGWVARLDKGRLGLVHAGTSMC